MKTLLKLSNLHQLLALLLICIPLFAQQDVSQKYVIGQWPGGLGVCITAVLVHLSYCEAANKIPVVYWNNKYYYNQGGFNGSENVWEYFFEPVSELKYEANDPINYFLADVEYSHFSYHQAYKSQSMRDHAYQLITKYIKIKPIIQSKIDQFYNEHMINQNTIGIHLRGTDKYTEEKPVTPERIITEALKYADENTQFLIATDERSLFDQMIDLLPGHRVIYYDCYRSDDGNPLFNYKKSKLNCKKEKPSYAQMGEDVIVEMALLAKSNVFLHTLSNFSAIVLYLNPQLKNIILIEQ